MSIFLIIMGLVIVLWAYLASKAKVSISTDFCPPARDVYKLRLDALSRMCRMTYCDYLKTLK